MHKSDRKRLRRRQAIEPAIRYLKADHGIRRSLLKGARRDALRVVLCAAGFELKCLMRAIDFYLPVSAAIALMKNIMQVVTSAQSSGSRLDQARLVKIEN